MPALLSDAFADSFSLVTGLSWPRLKNKLHVIDSAPAAGAGFCCREAVLRGATCAINCGRRPAATRYVHVVDAALLNRPVKQTDFFATLTRLQLCGVKLTTLDGDFLESFQSLAELDLSCNRLQSCGVPCAMKAPAALRSLNLAGNMLESIPNLRDLRRLVHLNVAYNLIQIDEATSVLNFTSRLPDSLISLNIAFNRLENASPVLASLAGMQNLRVVRFTGNPFVLDSEYMPLCMKKLPGVEVDGRFIKDLPCLISEENNETAIANVPVMGPLRLANLCLYFGRALDITPVEPSSLFSQASLEVTVKYECHYSIQFLGMSSSLKPVNVDCKAAINYNEICEKTAKADLLLRDEFSAPVMLDFYCHLMKNEKTQNSKATGSKPGRPAENELISIDKIRLISIPINLADILYGENILPFTPAGCMASGTSVSFEVCLFVNSSPPSLQQLNTAFDAEAPDFKQTPTAAAKNKKK